MKKLLNDLKEQKELCEIYSYGDFDALSVGVILAFNDKWCLYACVKTDGNFDGYCLEQTESIIRVSRNTIYLDKIKKLIDKENAVFKVFDLPQSEELFASVMAYIKESKKIFAVKLFDDSDCLIRGYLHDVTDGLMTVRAITDYGEYDGLDTVRISDVTGIYFDSENEEILSKILKG